MAYRHLEKMAVKTVCVCVVLYVRRLVPAVAAVEAVVAAAAVAVWVPWW